MEGDSYERELTQTHHMHRQPIKYLEDICELPPLPIWVKIEVELLVFMCELVDMNLLHLSTTLVLIVESYRSMEAYGNHYKVDDASSKKLVSFYSGVACVF